MRFKQGAHVVMIGDSITDSGRHADPEGLGNGYVRIVRDWVGLIRPEWHSKWTNRGVSGDRVLDLRDRWERDVLRLRPDVVSISIGINDVWRQVVPGRESEAVYVDEFEATYRALLHRTARETDASMIVMETTVIEEDVASEGNRLLTAYNDVVRQLAEQFECTLVPTNAVFHDYLKREGRLPLTTDGVHMTSTGNALMAKAWMESVFAGEVR